jgi:hypothetical protein
MNGPHSPANAAKRSYNATARALLPRRKSSTRHRPHECLWFTLAKGRRQRGQRHKSATGNGGSFMASRNFANLITSITRQKFNADPSQIDTCGAAC